jgi:hypothetical protein
MGDDQRIPTSVGKKPAAPSPTSEVAAFLKAVEARKPSSLVAGSGRLVFALDATMSRQPTWDTACVLQADMFQEATAAGGLAIQLVYFRGLGECRASGWVADGAHLSRLMRGIDCRGGHTQLARVLRHVVNETARQRVQALVYVGDAMEENLDALCAVAGELGLLGVPAFMFQEGRDAVAERAYREIARLTGGAYCRFDAGSARQLGDLLRAVAAYAAGGRAALTALSQRRNSGALHLLEQLK